MEGSEKVACSRVPDDTSTWKYVAPPSRSMHTHQGYVHGVEDLADVIVELLRLRDVVADPEVALQVDVLDEQRVEGVDVARDHVPLLLDLPLHLRRVVGRSLEVPPARSGTSLVLGATFIP